jgi:predicted Zn finger-like uncharacterized protein
MDVRCERCNTDYEFDDALVSGRGTTVKCTNCGHKFKIRRGDGDFSEDFWNVQTHDGRTLVFTSLRELQRAIQTNLVERHDLLSRGGLKQKPIGQIPELAPFFDQRDQRRSQTPPPPPVTAVPNVTASVSQSRASRPPPPPGAEASPLAPPRKRLSTRPDYPPPPPDRVEHPASAAMPSMKKTLHGTGNEGIDIPPPPPAARISIPPPLPAAAHRAVIGSVRTSDAPPPHADAQPQAQPPPVVEKPVEKPLTRTQPIAQELVAKVAAAPPAPIEVSSPLPPPSAPVRRSMHHDDDGSEDSEEVRSHPSSHIEPLTSQLAPRRSVGGYIVATVVLGGILLIGAVWAKDHLGGALNARPQPVAPADPRVSGLLTAGEKALADGNLETAKESFDKASALAEKDPRVLLDVARLATTRADVPWLRSRLLAADATDDVRLTKDTLIELSMAARKAADDAIAVAPDDPAAIRTKIDALRISGDRDAARALVSKVSSTSSQPETAYVLAALDLADPEPLWSTVIERLRVAAGAESGPGRARAGLAYALARSGDTTLAKAEVDRLAAMQRQHVLLPLLRAFADHAKPAKADAVADGGLALANAHADAGRTGARERGGGGGGEPALPSDARQIVAQAEAARAKGDYDRALALYNAAVDRNPSDTEALNGLAAIAYARRDLPSAKAGFRRVLSINPSFVPALVGAGDVDWESGDRASAMKTYKEIMDRFPEGSYPARVKQRVESASAPAPAPAPPPAPSAAPALAPAPADLGGGG